MLTCQDAGASLVDKLPSPNLTEQQQNIGKVILGLIAFQVLKDNNLKEALLQAQKLETISIGIVQFYHLLAYEQSTIDSQTSVNTYLKNLMFQIQ